MKHRNAAHTVYVITERGEPRSCKIGITMGRGARNRAVAMQCGNPRLLEVAFAFIAKSREEALRIEERVHKALQRHRVMGEWFAISADTAISAIADAAAIPAAQAVHRTIEKEAQPWLG